MKMPEGELDLLAIGETLVDFIAIEETDWLRNHRTAGRLCHHRRHQQGEQ
jgi:hypothetical protein